MQVKLIIPIDRMPELRKLSCFVAEYAHSEEFNSVELSIVSELDVLDIFHAGIQTAFNQLKTA